MGIDAERLESKIAYIREQVESIKDLLARKSREEVLADPWMIKGLKYAMQTSVEAMIDISFHIAAKKFGYAPRDARDAIKVLGQGGVLAGERVPVYSAMVGFRNRIVHGYQDVSDGMVYEMAYCELGDFLDFIKDVLPVLDGCS